MAVETPRQTEKRSPRARRIAAKVVDIAIHPGHSIAHGLGVLIQPFINSAQYRTFAHPEKNEKKIEREMYRTFRTAGRTVHQDNISAVGMAAQIVLGAGLGEHMPIPTATFGFTGIPTPFQVNLEFPLPLTGGFNELLNHLPLFHFDFPTMVNYHEFAWPLFTSNFVTSGINIFNAIRAHQEHRPAKRLMYSLFAVACFSHVPLIFNSIWYEALTAGPQKIQQKTFVKNAELVLSGKADAPDHKPWYKRALDALKGEIVVNPSKRHVFVDAVNKQFTPEMPKKVWEDLLISHEQLTTTSLAQHIQEEEAYKTKIQGLQIGKRVQRAIGKRWHHFLSERDENKLDNIHAAQKFIEHTEENNT